MSTFVYLLVIIAAGILLLAAISVSTPGRAKVSKKAASSLNRALIRERWTLIQTNASAGANGLKNAITDADKLFDYTMRELGYPGDTMAERLKIAQAKLSDREAVWRAHKLRNSLAHDLEFDLVVSQARDALRGFEQGLKDLGAL